MRTLPPNFLDVEQGTSAWFDARRGCVTASRVADAIAVLKRKDGESAARRNYRMELVCERLSGGAMPHYVSPQMEYGIANEPLARTAYEMLTGRSVDIVGLVYHPRIKNAAASPDGLVGENGLLEIKVPDSTTHIEYLYAGVVPEQYQPQMLWQMACTGYEFCDFVSHDPRMGVEKLQTFIIRFIRDDQRIAEMEKAVEQFLGEVDEMVDRLLGGKGLEQKLRASLDEALGITDDEVATATQ